MTYKQIKSWLLNWKKLFLSKLLSFFKSKKVEEVKIINKNLMAHIHYGLDLFSHSGTSATQFIEFIENLSNCNHKDVVNPNYDSNTG